MLGASQRSKLSIRSNADLARSRVLTCLSVAQAQEKTKFVTVGTRLWISGGGDVEKVKETQKKKEKERWERKNERKKDYQVGEAMSGGQRRR